jgi:DNA-binding NarL/FixJ family response regulator
MIDLPRDFGKWLTPREIEILSLLQGGTSPGAIAEALGLAPRTVTLHVQRTAAKFKVRNIPLSKRDGGVKP